MAKARAIIKRRKAVDNIRKITRTMELIATARFRKAMDRAVQAEAYTRKIAEMAADLGGAQSNPHPLYEKRPTDDALLLVLSSNRGLAGGYNGNVLRAALHDYQDLQAEGARVAVEVSGKRGQNYLKFRKIAVATAYNQFEDRPGFPEVEVLADRYMRLFLEGGIDRLDVAYTRFVNMGRQEAVVRTLLPIGVDEPDEPTRSRSETTPPPAAGSRREKTPYEFLPDAAEILKELVPASFKARLFKCFLDAAVSEQIARMVAMKGASQNADELSKHLTRQYNRARQSQITGDLADIVGAAMALE